MKIFFIVFLIILLVLCIIMLILTVINNWLPKWFCEKMGWHIAPTIQGFDGCSFNGNCPRCGKRVLQDSQGNWFNAGPG
jgi:hypothetical protein